jgi:alkylation response protein AidB-like acyl-CoA dehydrogenase
MDFRFSDDQLTLAESVRDYLAGTHGPEILRRLDAEDNRDPEIWQGLVDMGLTGLCVPEEHGGLGLGLIEATLIATECGRACLAEPLVDTAFVTVPFLQSKGETDILSEYALGERTIPVPHSINPYWADGAALMVNPSVDPLRLLFENPDQVENDPHLLNLGALMSAAQLVGLAEAMLHQANEYAKIRTQFGQPIGAFQAIKHQLANCAVAIEFAKPVLWRAAAAMQDSVTSAPVHVSHAKVATTDAAMLTAETAIQVHGAMGYTYEVDLHFWMKRSWALAGAWGDRSYHYRRLDDAILGGSLHIGPEHTFA